MQQIINLINQSFKINGVIWIVKTQGADDYWGVESQNTQAFSSMNTAEIKYFIRTTQLQEIEAIMPLTDWEYGEVELPETGDSLLISLVEKSPNVEKHTAVLKLGCPFNATINFKDANNEWVCELTEYDKFIKYLNGEMVPFYNIAN